MKRTRKLFLPMFGLGLIATIVAISSWFSGGSQLVDGVIFGVAIILVWLVVIFAGRRQA